MIKKKTFEQIDYLGAFIFLGLMNYLFIFSLIQDSSVSIDSGYSGEVWYSRVYLEQVTGATGAGWWMCKVGDLSQTARYTCSNRGCLMIVKNPHHCITYCSTIIINPLKPLCVCQVQRYVCVNPSKPACIQLDCTQRTLEFQLNSWGFRKVYTQISLYSTNKQRF